MPTTKVSRARPPDEQLDRAIEEVRGVLHEEEHRPDLHSLPPGRQFYRHHEQSPVVSSSSAAPRMAVAD